MLTMHRWSVACPSGHFLKDIFGKFDGYLSPSQNLKFADVPSGLAAISKVPLEGWLQVLLVAGLIETQLFKDSLHLLCVGSNEKMGKAMEGGDKVIIIKREVKIHIFWGFCFEV